MANIGPIQLVKIVERVGEVVGHPLKAELGTGLGGFQLRVVNEAGVQIVPTDTPAKTVDRLEDWLRGYLYARMYSGLKQRHGWDKPEDAGRIIAAAVAASRKRPS